MEDLYKLLETRCADVFEMNSLDPSHEKQAVLSRGLIAYYFSKLYPYLAKVYGTGFDVDFKKVQKDAFVSSFSYLKSRFYNKEIEGMNGVEYYFHLAKRIWDFITDGNFLESKSPFSNIPNELIKDMPPFLCNARLFRDHDMTMAGLIFFMAPLLSLNDRYRFIEDVAKIFAKDISFYQGEHLDPLYDAIANVFPKSTMFSSFKPFFKNIPSSPLGQLSRILFSYSAPYAQINKESDTHYSFSCDLSQRGLYQPVCLKGEIDEEEDKFIVTISPLLSKFDLVLDNSVKKLTFYKDILPDLAKHAQRIPPFIIPLGLAYLFKEYTIDQEAMRSIGPALFSFFNGSFYYDDRERADVAYKPLYRAGFCFSGSVAVLNFMKEMKEEIPSSMLSADVLDELPLLTKLSGWMNKIWKYDLFLGGDFYDDEGKLVSLSTTDIAKILSKAYDFLTSKVENFQNHVVFDYALRGVKALMNVYVTEKYANLVTTSKKILDPFNLQFKDWRMVIENKDESEGYLPGKLISDDAISEISKAKPQFDTWLCDLPNGIELSPQRYVKKLTKVHIVSSSGDILIKLQSTGLKELTLYVVNEDDLSGITGKDGTPLTIVSSSKQNELMTVKEAKC